MNERKYTGETSRNAFTREREHWKGIAQKSKDSPFHVHGVEEHRGNVQAREFEMKVTRIYGGDATKRQVTDAVTIQHVQGAGLLNRQDEWRQVNLRCINPSLS